MKHSTLSLLACLLAVSGATLQADTVTTTTGDVLHGTIKGIQGGNITLETDFAGTLQIAKDKVAKVDYTAEGEFYVRTDPANEEAKTLVKVGRDAEGNTILIPTQEKAEALAITEASTLWTPGDTDPDFPPIKRWAYSASLGITGNSGASNDLSVSAYADAVRTGEETTFKLYGSYNKTRSEGELTAERYIGGLDFEHRPYEYFSWYVRDEAQHNRFNDYKLRNVLGLGYGLYVWNEKTEKGVSLLRFRTGLAHTYVEHYTHEENSDSRLTDSDIALDLGLLFHYDFSTGVQWNTEITYTPLIDDLDKGTLVHESKLSYLLSELATIDSRLSDISLEAGMRNEYQTQPEPGMNHTDTTWYVRLKKSW